VPVVPGGIEHLLARGRRAAQRGVQPAVPRPRDHVAGERLAVVVRGDQQPGQHERERRQAELAQPERHHFLLEFEALGGASRAT
jgi:hypothetical protein